MCHTSNYRFENVLFNLGRSAHLLYHSWQDKGQNFDMHLIADSTEGIVPSKFLNVAECADLIRSVENRDGFTNVETQGAGDFDGKTFIAQKQMFTEVFEPAFVGNGGGMAGNTTAVGGQINAGSSATGGNPSVSKGCGMVASQGKQYYVINSLNVGINDRRYKRS